MTRYLANRLLQSLLVLLGVTVVVFLLVHLIPGDPGRAVLGSRASEAQVAALDRELGLDQSLVSQYVEFLGNLVRGDFGQSISTSRIAVGELIGPRILPTFALVTYAIVLAVLLAVPVALISALRANRLADHVLRATSVFFYAIPSFWFGLMLAVIFGVKLHVFPTAGFDRSFPVGMFETLTLPALTIALFTFPVIMRILRSSLIETLKAEFVVSAHARGLSEVRVLLRHVLRNSLTSGVTFLGVSAGTLLSFAVVVEQVFAIPGLGSLLVSSVLARDYPTVQVLTLIFAVAVLLGNLAADLSYGALDPRVRT